MVRYGGREVTFDWSSDSASIIQWAAFFSDCEHEVLEVTDGHRLTLRYNMYWTDHGPASMADNLNILKPASLHFSQLSSSYSIAPTFCPRVSGPKPLLTTPLTLFPGGLLGFTCTHAYPHTSYSSANTLHHTLKGLDMVVYQALKRLTASVRMTHALDDYSFHESVRMGRRRRGDRWFKW